jgi:hypothetical protein
MMTTILRAFAAGMILVLSAVSASARPPAPAVSDVEVFLSEVCQPWLAGAAESDLKEKMKGRNWSVDETLTYNNMDGMFAYFTRGGADAFSRIHQSGKSRTCDLIARSTTTPWTTASLSAVVDRWVARAFPTATLRQTATITVDGEPMDMAFWSQGTLKIVRGLRHTKHAAPSYDMIFSVEPMPAQ